MAFAHTLGNTRHTFADLRQLLARATPLRSGDLLAGLAAESAEQRVAAQCALADLPLKHFLAEQVVPYENDEVTRLIVDTHDGAAFAPVRSFTVGELRDWLLSDEATPERLAALAPGLTPEMAAAVSKLMRVQDLIAAAAKIRVVTRFRTTVGLARSPEHAPAAQPPHRRRHAELPRRSSTACCSAPATRSSASTRPGDNVAVTTRACCVWSMRLRQRFKMPVQSCVLAHVTTQMAALQAGAPVDLIFQSIAGTEAANRSFGVNLALLREAHDAGQSLRRGAVCADGSTGDNFMYFETGQGSALSANAHHGVDQQTLEARAYAVARRFRPMLVNTVVGFIGPEYLYDGKQIARAGLEDHFCGKLLGLPMGCDVCYTNHAEADQDDMDALLTLLGAAGVNYIMGVPGADDIMLNYQSTSFHDALYLRRVLGLKAAPEFEAWLAGRGLRPPGARSQPP